MSELYEKLLSEAKAERRPTPTQRTSKAYTQDQLARWEADLPAMTIYTIASLIRYDWRKPYFGAVPYVEAMRALVTVDDVYGHELGDDIVRYFLSNAQTWRGPVARMVKKELRRRV